MLGGQPSQHGADGRLRRWRASWPSELLRYTPFLDKVSFVNSGSEAVEASLKMARKGGRPARALCTSPTPSTASPTAPVSAERRGGVRKGFGPLLPDCRGSRSTTWRRSNRRSPRVTSAAFIVEPIQGHGVNVAADGYLSGAQDLCRAYGARCSSPTRSRPGSAARVASWAIDRWDVEPDMVLVSKALSGVATFRWRRCWRASGFSTRSTTAWITRWCFGSTFAANDMAMAAGIATLEVIRVRAAGRERCPSGRLA